MQLAPHARSRLWSLCRFAGAIGSSLVAACSVWAEEALSDKASEIGGEGGGGGAECGEVCQGLACCEGACVDLASDGESCGECGNGCGAGQLCCEGVCRGGFGEPCCSDADCHGKRICSGNRCIPPCKPGKTACDGECVSLWSDPDHCGECGNECPGKAKCKGGQCRHTDD